MRVGTLLLSIAISSLVLAQRTRFPEPSLTAKGTLTLPLPIGIPVFTGLTESIGGIDACVQYPVWKGLGFGVGGRACWFGIEERAFAPQTLSGEIFRATYFGKVQWEKYTGKRTFIELAAKVGLSDFRYTSNSDLGKFTFKEQGLHTGAQFGLYLHASDNLAFGLQLGYERDQAYLAPDRFNLDEFPPRFVLDAPEGPYDFFTVGLGFITRFSKSEDEGPGEW
ncbi:MAG: hypothetical protein IPI41_07110 [Flavobacteriales bacterium]|nr:hypothetical protein [Flavobacteriales bacterium]